MIKEYIPYQGIHEATLYKGCVKGEEKIDISCIKILNRYILYGVSILNTRIMVWRVNDLISNHLLKLNSLTV